ncbi:hypothetical protein DFH06DRAFT_1315599 [Mycena polygramma]|nr:hypothetical protein DFH06DRAFT_1315599 [Mycena polygramma]
MPSTLDEQLAALTLDSDSISRSPSSATSLSSSSSGSTEYFSDEDSRPSTPDRRPTPPRPSSPRPSTPDRRPSTPPRPSSTQRLYSYSSPTKSGLTQDWSEAAHATVGIPNASSHRLTPRRRKNKGTKTYVVFFGRVPGWYNTWAEVEALTQGVRGVLHQSYPTPSDAEAAFHYAEARLWTGVCTDSPQSSIPCAHLLPRQLPMPVSGPQTNSLHSGMWYTVYKGLAPGVYQSFLECGLNTAGIPGATYDAASSMDVASERFLNARRKGEVLTLSFPVARRIQ